MQVSDLPPVFQYLAYAIFAILAGIGMFVGYNQKKKPAPAQNNDIILTGAGMVDMNPIRKLSDAVEDLSGHACRAADAMEAIEKHLQEYSHEARVEREVKERLAAELLNRSGTKRN